MFIATPCTPAGRPNRKSDRMMPQSGAYEDLGKPTTRRLVSSIHSATPLARPAASTVPSAAPRVPRAGIGPRPRIRMTLKTTFRPVIHSPKRIGVRTSPAARSAPPNMK